MLRTTTLRKIIKGSPTSSCFLKSRKLVVTKLESVASDWAGFCVTATETARELPIPSPRR